MKCLKLFLAANIILGSKETYNTLVNLVKRKIDNKDYICLDTDGEFTIHEVFLNYGKIELKKLDSGLGWDASDENFVIENPQFGSNYNFVVSEIAKKLYTYKEVECLNILKIKNNCPFYYGNNCIVERLRNINNEEWEIDGVNVKFNYDHIEIDNPFLRNILIDSDMHILSREPTRKTSMGLYKENDKLYLHFFIKSGTLFYVFKIDIQDYDCQSIFIREHKKTKMNYDQEIVNALLKKYTVTDLILNICDFCKSYLTRTKTSLKVNETNNFNLKNERRNFSVNLSKKVITFKNLNTTFLYSFNEKLNLNNQKHIAQFVTENVFEEFTKILYFFDKVEKTKVFTAEFILQCFKTRRFT